MPRVDLRQIEENSCSAACLTCAAIELGIKDWQDTRQRTPLNPDRRSLASIQTMIALQPTNRSGVLYSMPTSIVLVARFLTLYGSIYCAPGTASFFQRIRYRRQEDFAQQHNILVNRVSLSDKVLAPNQRELRVVYWHSSNLTCLPDFLLSAATPGLHYVMRREDNSIMDPAVGRSYESMEALNDAHEERAAELAGNVLQLKDTGIGVFLSTHDPDDELVELSNTKVTVGS